MTKNEVLKFLNLLDRDGNLSITNVVVIVTLIKLAMSPSASITEAGSLLIALGSYAHKRHVNSKASENTKSIQSQVDTVISKTVSDVEDLKSKVSSLSLQAGFKHQTRGPQ